MDEAVKVTDLGNIRIASDVISLIASIAASEVEGVVTSTSSGIAGMLGRGKGVKVELENDQVNIDLFIVIDYGARIPDISWKLQEGVNQAVETMTGLNVSQVNVHVQGINFPEQGKPAEEES